MSEMHFQIENVLMHLRLYNPKCISISKNTFYKYKTITL